MTDFLKRWFVTLIVSAGVAVIATGIQNRVNARHYNEVLAAQKQQGQDGLELIYQGALKACRRSNDNAQQLVKFSNLFADQFAIARRRAQVTADADKTTPVARSLALVQVRFYDKATDALPRPAIPNCLEVTPNPAELAQQVRNNPGKSNTTTAPAKTTP